MRPERKSNTFQVCQSVGLGSNWNIREFYLYWWCLWLWSMDHDFCLAGSHASKAPVWISFFFFCCPFSNFRKKSLSPSMNLIYFGPSLCFSIHSKQSKKGEKQIKSSSVPPLSFTLNRMTVWACGGSFSFPLHILFFLFPSSFRLFDCHETRRIFMQFNMFEWTEDQNSPPPPPPKNPQKKKKKNKRLERTQPHLFFFTGGSHL